MYKIAVMGDMDSDDFSHDFDDGDLDHDME